MAAGSLIGKMDTKWGVARKRGAGKFSLTFCMNVVGSGDGVYMSQAIVNYHFYRISARSGIVV